MLSCKKKNDIVTTPPGNGFAVMQGKQDAPLLFDKAYRKKAAYTGLWKGLKQQ
jgi:hypothetical protein